MTNDTYYRTANLLEAELGDEIVALDADSGICFGFNDVASTVWRLLEHPKTEDELRSALEAQYEVQPDQCRSELAELLQALVEKGIVGIRDSVG
jgi:hypothetical protein